MEKLNNQQQQIDSQNAEQHQNHKKGGIHSNALYAARMGRSAVAYVDPHQHHAPNNIGTNVNYEERPLVGERDDH